MIALEIYSATSLEYTATISFGSYSVKCICHCFKYSFGNFLETPFEFFSEILLGIPLTIYVGNSFHSSFGILFEQYFFDNSLGSCLVILFFQIWYFFWRLFQNFFWIFFWEIIQLIWECFRHFFKSVFGYFFMNFFHKSFGNSSETFFGNYLGISYRNSFGILFKNSRGVFVSFEIFFDSSLQYFYKKKSLIFFSTLPWKII